MRTLAIPKTAEPWSLTSLREKLIKIGAKVVSYGRYTTFQMAEVTVPRQQRHQRCASMQAKLRVSAPRRSQLIGSTLAAHAVRDLPLPTTGEGPILGPTTTANPGNVGEDRCW
jgi:hypothetical protein